MMEKKYADRLHWKRVTERNFRIQRMQQGIVPWLLMKIYEKSRSTRCGK